MSYSARGGSFNAAPPFHGVPGGPITGPIRRIFFRPGARRLEASFHRALTAMRRRRLRRRKGAADALHCRWIDAEPVGNDPYARPPTSRQSLTDSFLQRRSYRRSPEAVSLVLESRNGSTDSFNGHSPSRSRGSGQAKVRYSAPCAGCSCAPAKPAAPWCRGRHWLGHSCNVGAVRRRQANSLDAPRQCFSGYLLMNPSRLGIFTLGKVSAFIASFSPIILLSARI